MISCEANQEDFGWKEGGKPLTNNKRVEDLVKISVLIKQIAYFKENQMEDPAANNEELDKILMVQAVKGKKNINKYLNDFYKTHIMNAKSGSDTETKKDKDQEEPKAVEMDETSSGLASDKAEVDTDEEKEGKILGEIALMLKKKEYEQSHNYLIR